MITKRVYQMMLMATMVVVMGLGMGSCVDNVDNGTKPSEKEEQEKAEEEQQAKAQKFWAVVSHLVDVDDYTVDYEDKTFEPTYGVIQGNDSTTRYVYTNDLATAAERFADLVGQKGIDENTTTYTYSDPDVGKLVYTKGTGRFLATVDVDIKQIPKLKKIVYMPGAYANGFFQGTAYYRFGDVVKRPVVVYGDNNEEKTVDEYWICVRPSFGPEKKGDSHWVCLNVLSKKNTWFYHSNTNKFNYYLPTGIGTNEEHMQNLAELLYAIYNPQKWYDNVTNEMFENLRMFHDFSKSRANLHNAKFWQSVQNAWRQFNITEKAMNLDSVTTRQKFTENIENPNPSINLLYKGYSWYKSISWNCSLFEATYTAGYEHAERNMHKADYQERTENVREFGMDCREMGYVIGYGPFFHNDQIYRWTIRHATGKELAGNGRYDEQLPIDGVEEVYRYYRDVNMVDTQNLPTTEPEVTTEVKVFGDGPIAPEEVKVGYMIGKSGQFYKTAEDAHIAADDAVAMVVYLGGNKCVEKGKPWNGLAIALTDVKTPQGDAPLFCDNDDESVLCSTNIVEMEHLASRRDGWAMTQRMKTHACGANHSHPAAETIGAMPAVDGCSDWFLPSTGQWDLAMQGMNFGTGAYDNGEQWGYDVKDGVWPWATAGVPDAAFDLEDEEAIYLTCTENNAKTDMDYDPREELDKVTGKCWYARMKGDRIHIETNGKYSNIANYNHVHVRPFIAFEYNDGGVTDPEEPWKPLEGPQVKSLVGDDGKFYATTYNAFEATGHMPMAYVVYYDANSNLQVDNRQYHGLAIGAYAEEKYIVDRPWAYVVSHVDTYVTRMTDQVRQQKGFSKWFVPTKDHWQMALEHGFDCQFNDNVVVEEKAGDARKRIREVMIETHHLGYTLGGNYWTATDAEGNQAYVLTIDLIGPSKFITVDKNANKVGMWSIYCNPMIAF